MVIESCVIFVKESKREGEGDCSMQLGGGGWGKSSCLRYWPGGEGFLEHGEWAPIQGNTQVDQRIRPEDADSPIVAAMKSLFTKFFFILLIIFLWHTFTDLFLIILLMVRV